MTATQSTQWGMPVVARTARQDLASAVGNPPEDVIARRSRGMSPAKKMAFAVTCPLCNAFPYRFCFGLAAERGSIREAFHEKRWESAFAAVAVAPEQAQ